MKFKPNDKRDLERLIMDDVHLGSIDTSSITDMSCLFQYVQRVDYSGIETWDVSNVTDMSYMFQNENFFKQC